MLYKVGFTEIRDGRRYLCTPPYDPSKLAHAHAIDFYRIWNEFRLIPAITSQLETHPSSFDGIYSTFPRFLNPGYEYKILQDKSPETDIDRKSVV